VWNGVPLNSKLIFQFCDGEKVTGWFEFPLDFQGWRRAHLRYSWKQQFKGKVSAKTDTIKILAPGNAGEGTVFFDPVVYNGLMDYRKQHVPGSDTWMAVTPDPERFPLPELLPPEQRKAVQAVRDRAMKRYLKGQTKGMDDLAFAKLAVQCAALGIIRNDTGISGHPIVKDPGFYKSAGLLELSGPGPIGNLMLTVAKAYHQAADPPRRTALGDIYMELNDHVRDQGLVAKGGFAYGWYGGRNMATATFLMQDLMRKRKRLRQAAEFYDYSYGASAIFDDDAINPNMDYFHIDAGFRLLGALMQPTPEAQYQWLAAFGRHLSKAILFEGRDGYKSDGSAFHHGFHYMAYAGYTSVSMAQNVKDLANTPFAISDDAFERMKRVLLNMRFFSNTLDVPLSMHGRHPFSPHKIPAVALLSFASCKPEPDGDLVSAFLRLRPDQTLEGYTAEAAPQGNLSMPYAGLMAHRRGDWLVTAKGYGKYVTHGESYANNNRFGRYLSNGYLDVMLPGGRVASGCSPKGWDFNRLDGTTVIYLPDDRLRVPHKGTEMLRTGKTFVGGVSHLKSNGAFVMQLEGAKHHKSTLKGNKTYFFFDDRVICLGSNIGNDDGENPTHTNLFQKALNPVGKAITVDGETYTKLGIEKTLPSDRHHLLIDPIGTGYYLPKGQTVAFARKLQTHRDHRDVKEMKGNFATAWIDHGKAPKGTGYEYVLLVGRNELNLKTFMDQVSSDNKPYVVHQKDENAHIVYDAGADSWGCAFFASQRVDFEEKGLPIVSVGGPCMAMASYTAIGEMTVTVADPNLRLTRTGRHGLTSQAETLVMSIGLDWTFNSIPKGAVTFENAIEIHCRHGESHSFTIKYKGD
jgi:chondroitin-sulfate-ABC endolyase/exolyase